MTPGNHEQTAMNLSNLPTKNIPAPNKLKDFLPHSVS